MLEKKHSEQTSYETKKKDPFKKTKELKDDSHLKEIDFLKNKMQVIEQKYNSQVSHRMNSYLHLLRYNYISA